MLMYGNLGEIDVTYKENGKIKITDMFSPSSYPRYSSPKNRYQELCNEGYEKFVKRVEDYLAEMGAEPGEYTLSVTYQILYNYNPETDEGYLGKPVFFSVGEAIYHDPSGEDIEYAQLWEGPWAYSEGKFSY